MLTVAYITSRPEPEFDWFLKSLAYQATEIVNVLVVDLLFPRALKLPHRLGPLSIRHVAPKPTIWQGPFRLTKDDWWAASNSRNTAICLCKTDWIAFVDDRSVLMPTWFRAAQRAMTGNYVAFGPYQKRHSMTVENGWIRNAGIITGEDNRLTYVKEFWSDPRHNLTNPYKCPGAWGYGCSLILPLDWALAVNGYDETCDGLSGEDYIFGQMLENRGYPLKFDTELMIVEDRSPDKIGVPMIRRDKGVSPNDKSHALLDRLKDKARTQHPWDLVGIRNQLAAGGNFPIPTGPAHDWYDGEPLCEMDPG